MDLDRIIPGDGGDESDASGVEDEDGSDIDSADGENGDRWLILNPVSGEGDHADRVHRLAADRGLRVRETEGEGDAAAFAREAIAEGIAELAVCGGDGTLKEVLSGFAAAGAIRPDTDEDAAVGTSNAGGSDADTTDADATSEDNGPADATAITTAAADLPTLSVIPAGTANIFAEDMGIAGIEGGFDVLDDGEPRLLDVGLADDEPFMKSCIAGLTADASSATSDDLKERFGSLAFVVTGVKRAAEFDPLSVEIDAKGGVTSDTGDENGGDADGNERTGEWSWRGEVLCLVIGNARRYAGEVGQANVEDGLLDVTLVAEMPPGSVVTEAIGRQLLGRETDNVTRLKARRIEIEATDADLLSFSLDGEIAAHDRLDVTIAERAVPVRVGPAYDPDPNDSDDPDDLGDSTESDSSDDTMVL